MTILSKSSAVSGDHLTPIRHETIGQSARRLFQV
jgi:hypothetical protein